MKCMILAGGFATRLYPLTLHKAKALLEFNGEPTINHIIKRIPSDVEIIVTTNRKFAQDFDEWKKTIRRPIELWIEEATSDDQKKGAIGAIDFWIRTRNIDDHLMIIAGDNYFELDLGEFINNFNGKKVLIAVYDIGDKEKACEIGKSCQVGLVTVERNILTSFHEKPPEAPSSIIATGIYILPKRVFSIISSYCMKDRKDNLGSFISYLMERETVHSHLFTEKWLDIGDEIKKGNITI